MNEQKQITDVIKGLTVEQAYEWSDRTEYLNDEQQDAFVRSILEKAGVPATQYNINQVGVQFEALIDLQVEIDYEL